MLNACRVVAYRRERRVMSKADAASWGIRYAPRQFHALISETAAIYAGEREAELDRNLVLALVEWATDA